MADGKIPQARIDDAARRILIGMIGVGLLDAPAPVAHPVASTPAHRALATEDLGPGARCCCRTVEACCR